MTPTAPDLPPATPLRVVPPVEGFYLAGAERAAADFLTALGVATDSGPTAETPARMARAYAEMLSPRSFDLTTFANDENFDELVLARAIPVHSVCEHHMLPFLGTAHVGYRILGLSKLARVVEMFARRPQVQERLTRQVADWLHTHLQPRGVGVVIEAEHLCMTVRGVRASGTSTVTSTLLGTLREDPLPRGVPRPHRLDPGDARRRPSWLTGDACGDRRHGCDHRQLVTGDDMAAAREHGPAEPRGPATRTVVDEREAAVVIGRRGPAG